MKILTGLIGLTLAVLALCFALANRQTAIISLWPFGVEVEAPLYLLSLGTLFIGLVVGAIVVWLSMIPHRMRTRRLQKDIACLNQKIIDLQQTVLAPMPTTSLLSTPFSSASKSLSRFWKFK